MVNRAFLLYLFLIAGTFSIALAMPSATDIGAPNMAATQHCPLISPLLESGQKIEKLTTALTGSTSSPFVASTSSGASLGKLFSSKELLRGGFCKSIDHHFHDGRCAQAGRLLQQVEKEQQRQHHGHHHHHHAEPKPGAPLADNVLHLAKTMIASMPPGDHQMGGSPLATADTNCLPDSSVLLQELTELAYTLSSAVRLMVHDISHQHSYSQHKKHVTFDPLGLLVKASVLAQTSLVEAVHFYELFLHATVAGGGETSPQRIHSGKYRHQTAGAMGSSPLLAALRAKRATGALTAQEQQQQGGVDARAPVPASSPQQYIARLQQELAFLNKASAQLHDIQTSVAKTAGPGGGGEAPTALRQCVDDIGRAIPTLTTWIGQLCQDLKGGQCPAAPAPAPGGDFGGGPVPAPEGDSRTGFSEDARVIVQLEFVLRKVNTDVLGIYKDMGSPDKYNSIVMEFNTDMTPFISEHLPRARAAVQALADGAPIGAPSPNNQQQGQGPSPSHQPPPFAPPFLPPVHSGAMPLRMLPEPAIRAIDNRMQYFREIGGQAYNLPADNTAALIVIIPHVLLCLSLLLAAFRWLRK